MQAQTALHHILPVVIPQLSMQLSYVDKLRLAQQMHVYQIDQTMSYETNYCREFDGDPCLLFPFTITRSLDTN